MRKQLISFAQVINFLQNIKLKGGLTLTNYPLAYDHEFSTSLHHKEMPHVTTTVTKTRFVGSRSQVYYDNLHNRPGVANLLQVMHQVFSNMSTNAPYHHPSFFKHEYQCAIPSLATS